MAPHTPDLLRERMVVWHRDFDWSPEKIAEVAGVSVRTVQGVLKLDMEYCYDQMIRLFQNLSHDYFT
jgi:DNA-directed RNA polymerase specialized sigma24 family protein